MPSETALAEQYDVNRQTVNRAMLILRADGLVHVERGNRTVVRTLPILTRDAVGRQQIRAEGDARGAFQAELARQGLSHQSEVEVTEQPPPADIAAMLGIAEGQNAITRSRRMSADDTPIQLATSWLPGHIAAGTQLMEADTGPGGTYSRLADLGYAPVTFTEAIRVRLPDDTERGFLHLDVEQRVFTIRRTASIEGGQIVEVTDIVMPAHQWELLYTWLADD